MTAVWVFLRAELRRRWRAWVGVALLAGLFAGVVTGAAAGARRTDSAYPRLLAWSKAPDLAIFPGDTPGFASPPCEVLARLPQSAPRTLGTRLALQPGAGPTALPVRSTVAGAAIGVAALSAALVFSASLAHLLATPRLYGVSWDAQIASTGSGEVMPAAKAVANDPHVAAWSVGYSGAPLQITGIQVDAVAMSQGRGLSLMPAAVEGRLPQRPDEIAVGQRTLAAMHSRVGAIARASVLGSPPARLKIVGTAVFPALSDGLALGQGPALTVGGLHRLLPHGTPAPPFDTLLVRFHADVSPQAGRDALASRVAHAGPFIVLGAQTPADLVNFGQLQNLPMLLGIALSGLALATIAHLLITSVRRRRRDFAILRALGFTCGQIRGTAAWQAGTLTGIALAIGIPAGVVCGRVAWRLFARHLGILPVLNIPFQHFAVVILAAMGLAVAISALPGRSAAHAQPAELLRSE